MRLKEQKQKQDAIIESLKSEIEELKSENQQQKLEINILKDEKIKNDNYHSFAIKQLLSDIERSETCFLLQERQKIIDYLEFQYEIINSLNVVHNCLNDYPKNKPIEELNTANSLINNLLKDLSSFIEEERIYIGMDNFNHNNVTDFSNIINGVLEIYMPAINSKQIELKTQISQNVYVQADPLSIEKIFTSVLENAIKYTCDKGNITVTLKIDKDKNILTIKDNGIGIPESDVEHIFNPFYRLNTKEDYKGFGFGLTLVKKIVDKIGGEITAKAKLKKGTEFNISFNTYKLEKEEKAPMYMLSNNTIPDKFNNITDIIEGDRDTLLIVDNNRNMLEYLRENLRNKYNIYFARDGQQAFSKLEELYSLPDMIISDVIMEKMDGIEFKTKLNLITNYQHIPFVFLSDQASFNDKIKAMKLGAVDYIFKPFKFEELETKINSIITNNKAQRSSFIETVGHNNLKNIDFEKARSEKLKIKCSLYNLTKTEVQIIELALLKKMKTTEIADELYVTNNTIRKHLTNIYGKMNVSGKDGAEKLVFNIS